MKAVGATTLTKGTKYSMKGTYDGKTVKLTVTNLSNGKIETASVNATGNIHGPDKGGNYEETVMALGCNPYGNEPHYGLENGARFANVSVYSAKVYSEKGCIASYEASRNLGALKDLTSNKDGTVLAEDWADDYILLDGKDDWINLGSMSFRTNQVTLDLTMELVSYPAYSTLMGNIEVGGVSLGLTDEHKPYMQINIGGTYYKATSPTALETGKKVHLLGSYDGNTIRFFINGQLVAQTEKAGIIQVAKSQTVMSIGSNPSGNSAGIEFTNMKVYTAHVYNKAYWDVSEKGDNSILAWNEKSNSNNAQKVYIASKGNIYANADASYMFSYLGNSSICTATTTITKLNSLNTSKTTNMQGMFQYTGSNAMTSLNLGSNFNTSKVKDMSKMFFGTGRNKMSTFNLGTNFDTVAVTNMSQMFEETGYAAMTSLNLGTKFNTAKVTDMSTMFADTGYKAMKTLTLGSNFNTSKVNDMSGMFWECGHDQLTSLDLGDLFYTSQATDMEDMFYDFGATSMTELDLGPAFNKMPTDTGIKSAGQSGWLKIYATEQVYSGEKAFKVSTSNSATTAITRGTIDPRYRVEWIIEPNSVSVDKTNKKMTIGLRARTNNNATSYYKSNITGSLGTGNITVYMDGEEASSVSKSLSGPTSVTNSTTGYNDVKYTLTLTGFEQSSRKSGKLYKEWSGNVSIEIAQGTVIDSYGNQDMAVKDGSRVNHSFDTEQKVDFIKPEFTYKYANTDIDKTNKRLIVDFTITDKFFTSSTTLKNASQVKVKLIDENKEIPASKIRKSIVYIDANGNEVAENSDSKNIYETRKGTKYKIGERYRLIVTGLEQSEYDDPFRNFSGTMSVTFPAGTVTDGSNNKNDAQIITIGINEPDKSGSAEIVDVVDPVWKASDFTVDRANKRATVTLTASDKYFKTSTLKESDITVKVDGATASNISKSLSTATKVANGVKYTLTLTNWEESTRQSGKYYYEWSGNVSLVIAANTIEDNSRNKSKQQTLTLGKADVLKPKIDNITVAQDKNNKTVTVGFDISDKYLKTSTRFNENNINVYIDGVNATSITKSLSRTDAGSNTVDGNTAVVRHHYVLTLSNFEQSTFQSGKSYKNWSGKLRVTVAGGIVQDTSDNSNDETELVNGEDVDFIKPSVTYVYSSGNIDHTTKTLTVDFTVADRYFSSSTATTDTVKNSIKVKLLDKNIDIAGLTKTVEKISDYNDTINGSTVKVGEKYRLTIGNLERTTETDGLRDYSGPMSITFPANMVMDKAQNGIAAKGNDAKTITIGISDPGSGSQEIVDVVSPVWEINKDETNLKTGTVKIRVKDKYLAVTNGKKDDLTLDISKVHVLVDKKESTAITKSITSGPTLITKGTNGYDTEYEYTIQLSNITPAGKNYIEFTPIETVVGGKAKYRDENGGAISLKIEAEAIKDAFKNTNAEQELEVGNIDNTGPEVFDIQKTIAANGDETFVFNITDKNYDPSKIVDISELNITIDGVQLSSNITKKLTCQTTITEQGTNIVRGHQYTLTLTGMKESVASFASAVTSNKRSYRENSGTVKIAINANAARDLGGNTLNTDTTTITSFNDKIAPEVVYKWSDSVINKNNKTFTMVFGITDKYYDASKSTKINVGELGITIDGKNPTGTTKTLSDPVPWIENGKTIGVKYTLVISNLQQLQIKDGDKYLDYSGVVTVTIPANKVKDTSSQGNIVKNITSGITIPGETGSEEIVDVVDPFWQVSDININKSTSQVTMTLKGTDKYFEKSTLTPNDIAVWIDGEEATSISRNLSPATELKDGSTKIGVQYTLTLSNWQESSKQSGKSYLEWSGDTKIKIAARKLKDTNDNYSIAQEFEIGQVDFIKPMIEKVSSTKGTNTETIVFDVNDKYISTKLSAANITTLINGEVADVKTTITSISDIKGTGIHSSKTVGHRYTVVVSNFNKGRKNGRKYSDWSGTVSLRIAADAVQDTSQNKNNATTITGDFVDFIKPEITYIYSSGNIDPTTKTLTVDFTVADRYFYSSTVTTDEIIKKIKVKLKENDKEIPNLAGKITITKLSDYTDGSRGKVGENYRLTIGGLQQNTEKDGLRDYSGPMSITFPADMVKDKEPNSNVTKGNNAKTITIGINDPGSGSQQIVDVVSPVWSKVSSTLRPGTATATIRVKDKYLVKTDGDKSKLTLKSNELQVKINNKVSSNATITVKDGPKLVASGTNGYDTTYEYTIQISNLTSSTDKKYKEFQPIETIVGRTAKYREEDGGEVYLVINKGAIQDVFDNTSDAGEIYVGNLDNIGPEVYDVQKTIAENGDETFVFNITDQNYDTSKIVDISELNITIDGVQLSSNITKKLTCQTPITEKGTNIVRGHQYILTLTGMKESVASFANAVTSNKRVYREYSGTIKITINADAARDKSGNTLNTDTTTITSFNDKLIPEVVYQWSNSVVDKTNKTFTMIFDITDKYYASSSLKFEDLTIKIGGKTPNWTAEGVGHSFGESDIPGSSGKGKRYTLTLSNLQALQIKDGDKYLDYSGVVTVAIPANKVKDTSGQGNVATTLTSGITIPGGSGSEKEVDVVEPYVQKMSSTVNAPARTASITIRISDRYFNKSTLTMENIEVYINGTKNSAVKSGWSTLEETETRTEKGTTSSVHVATNYTLNLSNFASDINQIKVVVPANVVKDTSENGNKQTEYIIYNVLKKQDDTGEDDTAPFFGNATVQRQNIDNVTFVSSTAGKNSTAWDVSAQGDGSILAWYTKNSNGTFKVYVGSDYEIFGNTDSSYLFRSVGVSENCTSTETITNIDLLNVSNVTNMFRMFEKTGWTAMTKLDLGNNFDTSNVITMAAMFSGTGTVSMKSLNLGPNFNTSRVTDMNYMLSCTGYLSMTSLDLGNNFDTSNVTNMNHMFNGCGYGAMTSLNLESKFNTAKVTDMSNMFRECGHTAMTSLDLGSNFDTSSVTVMNDMFNSAGFTAMKSLNLGSKFNTSNVTNMSNMFNNCGNNALTSLNLGSNFDTRKVTTMQSMFENCGRMNLESIELGDKFDTSNVTNMSGMFGCLGTTKLTSLNLGTKFDTSKVTNMSWMFNMTGYQSIINLDLGDKFNTANVSDMDNMFYNCGTYLMTSLDLGPAFTNIASKNTDMFTWTGKEGSAVIYAPESIFQDKNNFKLNTNANTADTNSIINYTRGTISPKYRTIWKKEDDSAVTIITDDSNPANSKVQIKLRGTTNPGAKDYASTLTSTLKASDIKVFIDGTEVTKVNKTLSGATVIQNSNDIQQTLTLTNIVQGRVTGKDYKEYSGNISLEIAQGNLTDKYGNSNMAVTSAGARANHTVAGKKTTDKNSTDKDTMFADIIKPEFTYVYADSDINHTDKTLTAIFKVADKYRASTAFAQNTDGTYDASSITVGIDSYDKTALNKAITKKLTLESQTTETISGQSRVTVQTYKLVIGNLEQKGQGGLSDGYTYSGILTLGFPEGTITDTSGHKSPATTITIGKNEPGGTGTGKPVDVVDPVWSVASANVNSGIVKIRVKDKYLTKDAAKTQLTLALDKIDVLVNNVVSSKVTKKVSGPVEIVKDQEYEYTVTLSNITPEGGDYREFTPKNPIVGGTAKYKEENGGDVSLRIKAGAVTDANGNSTKQQDLYVGNIDATGPEIYFVQKTPDILWSTETIVFNVTDKNYDPTDFITVDEISVFVDGINMDGKINKRILANPTEIITDVDSKENVVVGHQYTLELTGFKESDKDYIKSGRSYREYSGSLKIVIKEDAARDMKGNLINSATTTISKNTDLLRPEVKYIYSTSDINYTDKTFKMVFEMTDKYYKSSSLTLENLIIKIGDKIPDWNNEKISRSLSVQDKNATVNGVNKVIGKVYTLTITGLDQEKIKTGDKYVYYSGVISVTIPEGAMTDNSGNTNVVTTISSGVSTPSGEIGEIKLPEENTVMAMGVNPYGNGQQGEWAAMKAYSLKISNENGVISSYDATNNTGSGHSNSTTTWKDLTGSHNGTLNGPTWGTDYLQFDGVDDWVNFGQINSKNQVTLETTIMIDEIKSGNADVLGNWQIGGFGIYLYNGKPAFELYSKQMDKYISINATDALTLGKKTNIKGVYDGINMYLYVDGKLVAQTSNAGTSATVVDVVDPYIQKDSATVNAPAKTATIDFSVTDRYLDTSTLTNSNIEVWINGAKNDSVTKELAVGDSITETRTEDNKTDTYNIGRKYSLKITGFAADVNQIKIKIPQGLVTDKSGNTNKETELMVYNVLKKQDDRDEDDSAPFFGNTTLERQLIDNVTFVNRYNNVQPVSSFDAKNNTGSGHNNSANRWMDIYGNYNGTVHGATFSDDYLQFDGVDDYVDFGKVKIGNKVTLDVVLAMDEIKSGPINIIGNTESGGVEIELKNGIPEMAVYVKEANSYIYAKASQPLTANQKVRLTGTYDGTNVCLYIDGKLISKTTSAGTIKLPQENSVMMLGAEPSYSGNPYGYYAKAKIYSASIYNQALSADEIAIESTKWDVSAQQDNSIVSWYRDNGNGTYKVWVGSNNEMFGNTDSSYLFRSVGYSGLCTSTETITNINLLNVSSVTNMRRMFELTGTQAMTKLDLGNNFNTINVTSMAAMFSGTGQKAMTTLNLGPNFNTSKAINMSYMFNWTGRNKMTSLNLGSNFDTSNVKRMDYMFHATGYYSMTTLNLGSKFNTSKVTDMSYMFYECGYNALTSLDLGSNFDTSSVTNMDSMFHSVGYTAMTSLNLGDKFDTSNVTNMNEMFIYCGGNAMTQLNLGTKFDTSKVTTMASMFGATGSMAMTSLDLGDKFDTSNVENMTWMFSDCGREAMTTLNLGNKFNTSKVKSMLGMFNRTGNKQMTKLDLGDLFYTTNVEDMAIMFRGTGGYQMTELDLGPAFTNIPNATITGGIPEENIGNTHSANYKIFDLTGKTGCVIYAPEAIYQDKNNFKLNTSATTSAINYTRGTINAKYRTEWVKESATFDATNKNLKITLRGTTNRTTPSAEYISDLTSGLAKGNIKVYIDGVNATDALNKLNAISLGNATQTTENSRTGAKDVLQVVTLSNLEEAARQSGKSYKEWSGNIRLEIDQKTLTDTKYGNKNMAVTSAGARANNTVAGKKTTDKNSTDKDTMFADMIKPEITYTYVDSDINHTNKTLTAEFILTDKYYSAAAFNIKSGNEYYANTITVGIDNYDKTALNKAITKTLTKIGDVTDTVNGVANVKVGEKYRLVIGNLEQKGQDGMSDGYTYSGRMSLSFPEGTATDKSGNKSSATTITIGKNEPDGTGNGQIVDVVDPVWSIASVNIGSGVVKLRVKDKYLVKANSEFNLSADKIKVNVNGKESTAIKKTLSGPVEIKANEEYEYTLTLSNITPSDTEYVEFTPKNPIVGGTAKYKSENGGDISITIDAGAVKDAYKNSTKQQNLYVGSIDATGPAIYYVAKNSDYLANTESIIFNVTDKNYDPTDLITTDEMTVTIDGKTVETKNLLIDKAVEIITDVDGNQDVVVGHQYTLKILNLRETDQEFIKSNRKYRELSGTLIVHINEDAAKDLSGNTLDTSTTTITKYTDVIKPEVIYRYSTSDINYDDKTFTMVFDIVDKYYKEGARAQLTVDKLSIKIDGVEPDWTKVSRNFRVEDITDTVNGKSKKIGRRYTLTLDGLEQGKIASGKKYLDYSGVVTVGIPAGVMADDTNNENVATTISSGVSIPNGNIGEIGAPANNTVMVMGVNPAGNNASSDGFANIKLYSAKISNENGVISSYDATNNTGSGHSSTTTTWKDLTGSHNGTIKGATWGTDYLQFDGLDDWVNLGQISLTKQATLEATITADKIQTGEAIILTNFEGGGVGIALWDGKPGLQIYSKEMDRYIAIRANNAVTVGQKTKIKGVYDGINMYLYVDDKLVAQTSNAGTSATVVDVVDPLIEKISATVNAPAKTATLNFRVTDKYLDKVDLSKAEVWINGAKNDTVTKTLITGNTISETRTENNVTSTVIVGREYSLKISNFATDVNQIKVKFPQGAATDKSGNTNKETELMVYNVLKNVAEESDETTESEDNSIFFGNSNVKRRQINNITFVSSTSGKNSTAWDVSAQQDNSILAWYTTSNGSYNVYIGSEYEMFGNIISARLFQYVGEDSVCTATQTITNLNLLNVSSVQSMNAMFRHTGYNAMTELNLGDNFDTSNVTEMGFMFGETGYNAMKTLNLGNKFNTSNVTNMSWMFANTGFSAMTKLDLGTNFDTINVTYMYQMFRRTGYTAMTSLNLGNKFNTSKVTVMANMFNECGYNAMTFLNLGSNFDTSKVTNMSDMFNNCGHIALKSLNLGSKFNTNNVTDMGRMFSHCGFEAMTSLNLGDNFDTSNVINMEDMFCATGFRAMTNLDFGNKFNTIKVTNMRQMFCATGRFALKNLNLGENFDTSNVTNMNSMFYACGADSLTSLDLGDKFYTKNVKDMYRLFTNLRQMTSLDLGPAFTVIPNNYVTDEWTDVDGEKVTAHYAYEKMFENNGTQNNLTVYASEAIFQDQNNFKLNTNATTGTINYTKGTINPKYRTEWVKEENGVTIDKTNKNIKITLRGTTNTGIAADQYISDVTSSLTKANIKVYIDGIDATESLNKLNAISVGTATQTANTRTGAKDVLQVVTLSNLEEASRQSGKSYKEWSGNIKLEIDQKSLSDTKYGNKNMALTETGTRTENTVKETKDVSQNTDKTMFTDYIKPEITYTYADSDVDHTNKTLTVEFILADKYYSNATFTKNADGTYNASSITVGMDDYNQTELNKAITKTLTKIGDVTDTVNGVQGVKIGEKYRLVIGNLEQKGQDGIGDGYTYSGYMTLAFLEGLAVDKSGNKSSATTITIGKNEPDGTGDGKVVDVVDPVWSLGEVNTDSGEIKLRVKDKYLIKDKSTFALTESKITVYADGVVSSTIQKKISGPVEITPDEEYEYTLTLLNIKPDKDEYEEFTPKNPIVGGTAKYKKENGGEITLEIAAGAVTDAYKNKSKTQKLNPGSIDATGPEVYDIQKIQDVAGNKETFIFNVTDKNYDPTDLVTIDELTVWLDGKQVDIDGEITKKFITNPVAKIDTPVEIITTINGQEKVVGHQYTLEISSIVETDAEFVASGRKYRELSGTLEIKIDRTASRDMKGNLINSDTTTIADFVDMIKPEVIYKYSTSNIDKDNKTFKMEFDLVDKYCNSINDIKAENLTIKVDGKVPDWTKVDRNLEVSDMMDDDANRADKRIGRHYILTLSNLEQLQIKSGDNYLDYSGVITVVIPANQMKDTTGNQNVTTTLTSGVSIPGGTGSDTIVDVVDPLIEKISTTVDVTKQQATLNFKVTDKYFASSELSKSNIEIWVNGAKNDTVSAKNVLTVVKNLTEPRTVDGKTVQVQYGIEYSLKISGFAVDANQVKVKFPANLVKDNLVEGKQNGNKETDIIVYNVLTSAETESEATSAFLGSNNSTINNVKNIQRQNIDKVTFMNNIPETVLNKSTKEFETNANAWDVSAQQDKSIVAWYNSNEVSNGTYKVYIGSDSEIFANRDSTWLFSYIGYSNNCTSTETIKNLELMNTANVTKMSAMFAQTGYNAMNKLDLGNNFITNNVTQMDWMFSNCGYNNMTTFSLGNNFNTNNVSEMRGMFNMTGYMKLTSLELTDKFNTTNVTNMSVMFYKTGCIAMKQLNLGANFNTANVTDMNSMFQGTGYTAMTSLDLGSKFNTSKVENMESMFKETGYTEMTTLDLGENFDTSSVMNMISMFEETGHEKMTTLNLGERFNTSQVINMSNMFKETGYKAMTSLDLGNVFYTTSVSNTSGMFDNTGATAMTILDLGPVFNRIPENNTDMFKNTGTNELIVYAPESIYSNVTTFIANRY